MAPKATDLPKEKRPIQSDDLTDVQKMLPVEIGTDYNFKRKIVWFNAIGFVFLHLAGAYGLYRSIYAQFSTVFYGTAISLFTGFGVTVGAHRLYAHKAFKAHFIVRLFLILLFTMAGQNCLYIWVRDHRQHHKFSDTDADPHNANRGFFFSHVGWLMSRKHPAVKSKGKTIDMSDMEADWMVMFQKEFYKPLYLIFAMAIPIGVPVWYWNESYYDAIAVAFFARYIVTLNFTWLVNSAAHLYGYKPYDKDINPAENWFVSLVSQGEGWHNYHHAYPWDYRAAELGWRYSFSTMMIDLLATVGMITDRRTTSESIIRSKVMRTGDGTHLLYHKETELEYNKGSTGDVEKVNKEISLTSFKDDMKNELIKRPAAVHG